MVDRERLIYLYCIINTGNKIETSLESFTGSKVYTTPYCDVSAVVSESAESHYDPTLENMKAHETVIHYFLEDFAVLPMKFSTLCASEEKVMEILIRYYSQFKSTLADVTNRVEMGVKVFCDTEKIIEKNIRNLDIDIQGKSESQKYMLEKYKAYSERKQALADINTFLNELHGKCKNIAFKSKINKSSNPNIVLNAAYLIEKEKIDCLRSIIKDYKEKNADCYILLSGPWAAYNFVHIDSCT